MFIDFLLEKFNSFSKNDAIIWNDKITSYNELSFLYKNFKQKLVEHKILKGDTVSIEGDFSPNNIAVFLALIDLGVIIVPLSKSTNKDNSKLYKIAEVKYAISVNGEGEIFKTTFKDYKQNIYYKDLIEKSRPGIVLFSSGSSGEPKAAVHDLTLLLKKFNGPGKSFRTINFLLFDHWGGLNTMFHTLSKGGCIIIVKDRNPDVVCRTVDKHQADLLPTTPTFLNLLLISKAYEKYQMHSLKLITYGTEPMPESTLENIREIFPEVNLLQTYGLIELGVMKSQSESNNSLWVKIGGEGYETRVVDGILQIKAESTMLGYINAESPLTEDNWFITGDEVIQKGDYIKILGRKSEIINVGGEKVYPQEVENIILSFGNIAEVTVYGEKNPIVGNIVCANIRLLDDTDTNRIKNEIKSFCRKRIESYKVPVKINFNNEKQFSERFKKKR